MTDIRRFVSEQAPRAALEGARPIPVASLSTSLATVATARADADFRVEALVAVNTTGAADSVTVHIVPGGGSASAANKITHAQAVPANGVLVILTRDRPLLMEPGATLQALCGGAGTVNVYGMGYDVLGSYG